MPTNIRQFELALERHKRLVPVKFSLFVRKVALTALRSVVFKSPVDTGRFRGNWMVSVGSSSVEVLDVTDTTGGATISRGLAELATLKVNPYQHVYLTNNLPYAIRLEYGWSGQAPRGMLRVTVAEIQASIR